MQKASLQQTHGKFSERCNSEARSTPRYYIWNLFAEIYVEEKLLEVKFIVLMLHKFC